MPHLASKHPNAFRIGMSSSHAVFFRTVRVHFLGAAGVLWWGLAFPGSALAAKPAASADPEQTDPSEASEPSGSAKRRAQALAQSEKPKRYYLAVTLSPLHFFVPMLEGQVEFGPISHLGISVIGGVGTITVEDTGTEVDGETFAAYELGGQVVGYLNEFEGASLGVEVMWVRVKGTDIASRGITGVGSGFGAGPLVGYKATAGRLTLLAQLGFQYLAVRAEASSAGTTTSSSDSHITPFLNLNVGLSF